MTPRVRLTLYEWIDRVWSEGGPKGVVVRAVLQVLYRHVNNEAGNRRFGKAWPSVATIQACTSLSERAVRDALKEARETGWVRVEREEDGHELKVPLYTPTAPEESPLFLGTPAGVQEVRPPGRRRTPPLQEAHPGVHVAHPPPAPGAPDLLKDLQKNSKKEGEAPSCPLCSAPMNQKNGKRGRFWGCSTWSETKCSGKVSVDPSEGRADSLVAASRALSDKAKKTRESFQRDPQAIGELVKSLRPASRPDRLKPDTRTA